MVENKEIMARNILKYMERNDVKAVDVCTAIGVKQNTFSDWVNAKTYPRIDAIEKLATYFHISKADLVEDKEETYYLNDDAKDLAEFLFHNPDYKVLFDASRKVKPKDIEFVKNMIDRMNGENND
jgi:transcriptional regulator with XRE-family HTH domain